jgi:hypothetical protein
MTSDLDEQAIEWKMWQDTALKKLRCPYTALKLEKDDFNIYQCDVCDCFGWVLP